MTAEQLGLSASEIHRRLRRGMTMREVAETPIPKGRGSVVSRAHLYEYKGKKYSLGQLAELGGLRFTTVRNRIRRSGWTVERAVETKIITNAGQRKGYGW